MPQLTQTFPAQLWLNKLLLFFVIYFYLKEFVSLSQKLDHYTINSSKVQSYIDGAEFTGYSQCPKGHKGEGKIKEKILKTNSKPMMMLGGWGVGDL